MPRRKAVDGLGRLAYGEVVGGSSGMLLGTYVVQIEDTLKVIMTFVRRPLLGYISVSG